MERVKAVRAGRLDKLNLHTFPKLMLPKGRLSVVNFCHDDQMLLKTDAT